MCSTCHDKLPRPYERQDMAVDIDRTLSDDVYYHEESNGNTAFAMAKDTAKVPVHIKPLPFPSVPKFPLTRAENGPDLMPSVIGLLAPSPGHAYFEADLASRSQAHTSAKSELMESYGSALAAIKEKEKQLEILLATAQQDRDAAAAREAACTVAAADVDVSSGKDGVGKKSKKEEDKRVRKGGSKPHETANLTTAPENHMPSAGSQPSKSDGQNGQGSAPPGGLPDDEGPQVEGRTDKPRKPVKKRTSVPPDDDPDDSPDDDDESSGDEEEDEEEEERPIGFFNW